MKANRILLTITLLCVLLSSLAGPLRVRSAPPDSIEPDQEADPLALYPAPGTLDPTFGGDGIVDFRDGGDDGSADMVVQPDGKIVVCGRSYNTVMSVLRYNSDGSPDTTFSGDGWQIIDFGVKASCKAILLQGDGRIILAGQAGQNDTEFALARLNSDGSLDTTFGTNGLTVTNPGVGYDYASDLVFSAEGKILVVGSFQTPSLDFDFALLRYNSDGTLDLTFDSDGIVTTPIGTMDDFSSSIDLLPGGKILLGGSSFGAGTRAFALARYNANGSLDTTFDDDGLLTLSYRDAAGMATILQPDGKIVMLGNNQDDEITIVRLNPHGTLDTTFNDTGKTFIDLGSYGGYVTTTEIAIQSNGRIVVAGSIRSSPSMYFDALVVRFNKNGSLDTSFDGDGLAITDYKWLQDNFASGLALQADGKILITGNFYYAGNDVSIARYVGDVVKSIRCADPNPSASNSVNFTVTFQQNVTGVDINDFALSWSGALQGASITQVNGSGSIYTVSVNTGTGNGTLTLRIPQTATILAGGLQLSELPIPGDESYTIAKGPPSVFSITRLDTDTSPDQVLHYEVTFDRSVTGVGADDFSLETSGITGASLGNVSGSGSMYTVSVDRGSGVGSLRLDLMDNDSILDGISQPLGGIGAGNGNFSGETYSLGGTWLTFLGGSQKDEARGILVDANGNTFVTGTSLAPWGCAPVSCTVRSWTAQEDIFVAKLGPSGTLLWNTFLGGSNSDYGDNIAIDANGYIYVSGTSSSSWGSPVRPSGGSYEAFAAKLAPNGTLVWHSFAGGGGFDRGEGIGVDDSGNVFLAGESESSWGTPIMAHTGGTNPFAARFDSSGALVWNTFLGRNDWIYQNMELVTDPSGTSYVAGTSSAAWGCAPVSCTVRAYAGNGSDDGFVARFDLSGNLIWNTFLGGINNDYSRAIALDASNAILVGGVSGSSWGSPISPYTSGGSNFNAMVVKLNTSGTLTWNTFVGFDNVGYGIATDPAGTSDIVGSGHTSWGNPFTPLSTPPDGFLAKLNPQGAITANTFFGSTWEDSAYAIAVDPYGSVLSAGYSKKTWGTPLRAYTAGDDAFVIKLDFTPPTVTSILRASPNPFTAPASLDYTVTFSEPVLGVDTSDFHLVPNATLVGSMIQNVNCSGKTCTVTVSSGTPIGTLRLDLWDNDTILDIVGYPLGGVLPENGSFYGGEVFNTPKTFSDVAYEHWALTWIERLYNSGITAGCGTNPLRYCPEQAVRRSEMAVFLEKGMNGSSYTPPAGTGTLFTDVTSSHWAVNWIEQLYADSITAGCLTNPLMYCPEQAVKRSEMAVFLLRAKYGKDYDPPDPAGIFSDVPTTHWAAAWIEKLAADGITAGCGAGVYCPEQSVTRAQMAVFLVRTFSLP